MTAPSARFAIPERVFCPGIAKCEGNFNAGDVIRICDLDGTEFARGVSEFSATDIQSRKLLRTEVVHRNNLVIL